MAHTIVEAKKSHDLTSVSWRSREASSVIQFKSESLIIGDQSCMCWSESKDPRTCLSRRRWMAQLKESEFTLPLPFCSIPALKRLDTAYPHWYKYCPRCLTLQGGRRDAENLFIWHLHPVAILESQRLSCLFCNLKRAGDFVQLFPSEYNNSKQLITAR